MSIIRRFAVFIHCDDAVLTPEGAAELAASRSMHVQVVSHGAPLKVSAVVSASTLHKAIGALLDEVAGACPGADATQMNAIEVSVDHPRGILTAAS